MLQYQKLIPKAKTLRTKNIVKACEIISLAIIGNQMKGQNFLVYLIPFHEVRKTLISLGYNVEKSRDNLKDIITW